MPIKAPDQVFEKLFIDLHASKLWPDGKTISDALPLASPEVILAAYRDKRKAHDFDLMAFFNHYFKPNSSRSTAFKSDTRRSVKEHIELLWEILTREKDEHILGSSLLPLPYPYIVPGGRFNEIYYWDSYFTQLGLQQSGRVDMIENMIKNFAHLIETVGYIPNGNRSYFIGRSQPPFFSLMVRLLAQEKSDEILVDYFPSLEKEYLFWTAGNNNLSRNNTLSKHSVFTPTGVLHRYFDEHNSPRAEMYQTDVEEAKVSVQAPEKLFGHLRAACESGWDFSSRWLKNPQDLGTIQTLEIIPIDLNCLLFALEDTLAEAAFKAGSFEKAERYSALAEARKTQINTVFWNPSTQFFHDLNTADLSTTPALTLAGIFPLSFGIATKEQAKACAERIEIDFLKQGGVVTTTQKTGQQWDAPNGWAPLQWMTYIGLKNYGYENLAYEIAQRWVTLTTNVYQRTGKLLEKYNVEDISLLSGGGEYAVQDGFGWTNGVVLAFQNELQNQNNTNTTKN